MIRYPHLRPSGTGPKPPSATTSIGGSLVFMLGTFALFVAVSYPVPAITLVVGLTLAGVALRRILPALGRRLRGRMAELDVPGFGTVEIRVSTR
ncbi:hypothetical protein [Natrialba aegyptia]|uniref:Uncharacterized protein n=1 Tax=Natrialba aegyptia DSM 13077 TaxID=1227491 RepID=M0B8D0_9EURY|nr:hypothetical protein [Natrialba aegyptia]ELZ06523.1 hypothetical protein C480_09300 [Natrialba aegyptia DSM 13077]